MNVQDRHEGEYLIIPTNAIDVAPTDGVDEIISSFECAQGYSVVHFKDGEGMVVEEFPNLLDATLMVSMANALGGIPFH